MNSRFFVLLVAMTFALICQAQNPFVTHMYTADPSARVFNDTLYVYPSHDEDTATLFSMVDWHVFSTTDMKHWTDHGVALSLKDLQWGYKFAWAPDCAFKNGKYYFYYPVAQNYIGVAVGDKPWGPFRDPLGKPLITRQTPGVVNNRDLIDPEDDGTKGWRGVHPFRRSICVDYLYYNADGTIQEVKPTKDGVDRIQ